MTLDPDEKSLDKNIRLSATTSQLQENIPQDRPENKLISEKPLSAKAFFDKKASDSSSLTSRDLNRMSNLNLSSSTKSRNSDSNSLSSKPSSSAMVEERKVGERKPSVSPKPQSRLVKTKDLVDSDASEDSAEETDSEDDDDSDDDSDEEDEAEDSDEEAEVKQKKKKPIAREIVIQKSATKPQVKKVVKSKDVLVYEVLKRWWYCVPDWPPVGYNYSNDLAEKQLRKVDQRYWRIEPEIDATGFRKVYEVPSFPGVFRTSKGETIDLRPHDTCPSYENFKKKSILELCELLVTALRNQIEALQNTPSFDNDYLVQLKKEFLIATRSLEAQKLRK